ncbi:hypothetical protein AVEN_3509-1 [Araneus ventricosus]|uniref:Uncharacterized protein n=1 Tax=Araneus ventricosus TaxID=182803 RepID=A0A4Y2GXW9_ARAVE|nr:hypothetical protein AVEN_49079-1 [Araneus ventricosus]GBM58882.1 hypothetical protein AVEN_3509-1 [Araneus ventricosus]
MAHHADWKTELDENPNFSTTPRNFSSDFRIEDGFWGEPLQMVWNGVAVNIQFYISPRVRHSGVKTFAEMQILFEVRAEEWSSPGCISKVSAKSDMQESNLVTEKSRDTAQSLCT